MCPCVCGPHVGCCMHLYACRRRPGVSIRCFWLLSTSCFEAGSLAEPRAAQWISPPLHLPALELEACAVTPVLLSSGNSPISYPAFTFQKWLVIYIFILQECSSCPQVCRHFLKTSLRKLSKHGTVQPLPFSRSGHIPCTVIK